MWDKNQETIDKSNEVRAKLNAKYYNKIKDNLSTKLNDSLK